MPGFVANSKRVIFRVAYTQVAKIDQAFEFVSAGKLFAKVFPTQPILANVEIADSMVRVARGGKRIRCQRQVAVNFVSLVQEKINLFNHAANARG